MISLLVPWASCSLVTGIKSDCFGGCCHLLKCTVLHSPACVCATACFKGARGFWLQKMTIGSQLLFSLESFSCTQCYLCAIEVKPLSSPKSPMCKLLFCLAFFFIPGNGDGSGHVKGRPLHMWGFLGCSLVSEKSPFNANGYVVS